MKRLTLMTAIVLASAGAVSVQAQTPQTPAVKPIEVGAVAPDFELPAATRYGVLREPIKLSDFKGKTVVLAFFPKARTSGCTIQMHTYRDQYDKLFNTGQNIVLIAISADTPEVLASWAKDDQFQFVMASDKDLAVANKFGALSTRPGITNRNLFVVGPDGKIAWRAVPFREIDATAYEALGEAIKKTVNSASN